MSTQKQKFALFAKLTEIGFTYEEAVALRRIEMTLHRWAEEMCNGTIERDDNDDAVRPYLDRAGERAGCFKIADREASALRRLKAIVDARNERMARAVGSPNRITPYHQTDPRGCALYLVKNGDLPKVSDEDMRKHSGEWPLKNQATRREWILSCYYTRGLAVCA